MTPTFITIHCSATKPKNRFSVEQLRNVHVDQNGWSDIGYHFYITTDGELHPCRPLDRNGAHVRGHNANNIGICLEGGLNNDTGKPDDTYNSNQMVALKDIVKYLQDSFAIEDENIKGHRDWFGDANGDGVVDSRDWLKACPCFDVQKWVNKR
jgi:N-acetyl-anhydromuramyl-L-alanine amidase AmpD